VGINFLDKSNVMIGEKLSWPPRISIEVNNQKTIDNDFAPSRMLAMLCV